MLNKNNINNDTGLSNNSSQNAGRFYNADGSPNVIKRGLPFLNRSNLYHTLTHMSNTKFFLLVFVSFIIINLLFAFGYSIIGYNQLKGLDNNYGVSNFSEAFFFSCQTFTTVGYGGIHPVGFAASLFAAFESLIGLLSFALITGLLYGRFSKPRAFVRFAKNAVIAPYKDISGLMIRLAPFTKHILSNANVNMTLATREMDNGRKVNKFYNLDLEIKFVNSLVFSWTVVHPITTESPFYKFTLKDFEELECEIMVFLHAFDESFNNEVMARASIKPKEIVFGAKYKPMFYPSEDKATTILDFGLMDSYEPMDLPKY
jgi:inward rectifier potassium channel